MPFGLHRGYFSGMWVVENMPVLLRGSGDAPAWETWMSLSPHEIESQELGCRYAFGHTAIMGLGMGWIAINAALNPAVDLVTVVEHDPEVIDLVRQSGALDDLPGEAAGKMRVVEADALQWRPERPVDFLYADIWRDLGEPQTLDDVRHMQANVEARQIYYWGQELAIYEGARRLLGRGEELSDAAISRCLEEILALPLLVPPDGDYAALIKLVMQNRRLRRLPTVELPSGS